MHSRCPCPYTGYMGNVLKCPYCGQEKDKASHHYCDCHICGYKSAMLKAADGADLMIVDRRMPYLERRCQEIGVRYPDVNVIVDRRIVQDEMLGPNRRRPIPLETAAYD